MTNKILVLVGPTSSGKSEMAVRLAKKFNGEIISCDSRQIYRGMDLGTGKVEGRWQFSLRSNVKGQMFVYKSIPHHCIDYVSPRTRYSVDRFKRDAEFAIREILSRSKLPILCGGTMHWCDAVVYNQQLPNVPPNPKLRSKLEKESTESLFARIRERDPERAKTIDPHNKRRLIRALEIIEVVGNVPPTSYQLPATRYDPLWLGIKTSQPFLYKKIDLRLKERLDQGLIKEVQHLHSGPTPLLPRRGGRASGRGGISWKRLESFGLEYRHVSLYLQKKLTYDEMFRQLSYAIKHYSKRQLTWWKRNKDIHWIKNYRDAVKSIKVWQLP